jgi:sorting nexin-1/2
VSDPVEISGAVRYTVIGEDNEGSFRIQRRFKEFFSLQTVLRTRWPGVFIPAIPDKKILKSKDEQTVTDRLLLL